MNSLFRPARLLLSLVVPALFVAALASAGAQDEKAPVSISLEARLVKKTDDGKEEFAPAEKAKPGDTIEYVAKCRNVSDHAISNLKPVIPIPVGMDFLPETLDPAIAEARTASEDFKPVPLQREVRQADGSFKSVPVPATEYRGLRWTLPELKAGALLTVSVRVQVQLTKPAATPSPTPAK